MTVKRTVLVTGASSGIGRSICLRLLDGGHRVLGVARNPGKFSRDVAEFRGLELDLADLDSLPAALRDIARRHPEVDGVVCNAGRGHFGSLEQFSYEQVRSLVELNLISQIYVARAFLPLLKKRGHGDLLFMGSEAGLAGGPNGAVYSATKFALRGLAQSLRKEAAASGVRVSIVNPGMVRTAFFDALDFAPGEAADNAVLPEDVAEVVAAILAIRPGTVLDEVNLSPLKKVIRRKGQLSIPRASPPSDRDPPPETEEGSAPHAGKGH